MIRITAPHFVAGVIICRHENIAKGFVNECPTILHYMKYWSPVQIKHYCNQKKWKFEIINILKED